MKLPVRLTEKAEADLNNLYDYIQANNPARAASYVLELTQAGYRLGDLPETGRRRDDLGEGLRSFVFRKRQIIIYEIFPDRIEILRIFSAGRDIHALIGEDRN